MGEKMHSDNAHAAEAEKLDIWLDQHFDTENFKVSRRKFIEILFEYHFPELSFEHGRQLQNQFNRGQKMHTKEERSIAKDMNMLDKFMHRIKETVMTKGQAHKIIHSKEFRDYRNREWIKILAASRKYVSDYGQRDAHI